MLVSGAARRDAVGVALRRRLLRRPAAGVQASTVLSLRRQISEKASPPSWVKYGLVTMLTAEAAIDRVGGVAALLQHLHRRHRGQRLVRRDGVALAVDGPAVRRPDAFDALGAGSESQPPCRSFVCHACLRGVRIIDATRCECQREVALSSGADASIGTEAGANMANNVFELLSAGKPERHGDYRARRAPTLTYAQLRSQVDAPRGPAQRLRHRPRRPRRARPAQRPGGGDRLPRRRGLRHGGAAEPGLPRGRVSLLPGRPRAPRR